MGDREVRPFVELHQGEGGAGDVALGRREGADQRLGRVSTCRPPAAPTGRIASPFSSASARAAPEMGGVGLTLQAEVPSAAYDHRDVPVQANGKAADDGWASCDAVAETTSARFASRSGGELATPGGRARDPSLSTSGERGAHRAWTCGGWESYRADMTGLSVRAAYERNWRPAPSTPTPPGQAASARCSERLEQDLAALRAPGLFRKPQWRARRLPVGAGGTGAFAADGPVLRGRADRAQAAAALPGLHGPRPPAGE